MANATLEVMQEIEAAAKAVLSDYEQKISQLRSHYQEELDVKVETYEAETKQLVANETAAIDERLQGLKDGLVVTIETNDAKVRTALTAQKDELVQQIVDKVVARYGH